MLTPFFIRRGEWGTEAVLVEALEKYGNVVMVEKFLNCENRKLKEAAEAYAKRHNMMIFYKFSDSRRNTPLWGQGQ